MTRSHAKLYTIIVNWNGKTDTVACLTSLSKIDTHDTQFRVIVVDNGSSDHSAEYIKKRHPWVTVISAGGNLGFTGGNNVGIRRAVSDGAQYVWLLNNDTIVDGNVLSFMDTFADPKVGACGSKIYFAPGHEYHHHRYTSEERGRVFWYAGGLMDWDNIYASHRGVDEVDHGQFDSQEETPFITGCSFVVRTDVIRNVGMLDDAYYLYLEDLDWSVRIQKAGYKTMYVPSSVVWHINAGSTGKPGNPTHEYYMTRNRLVFGLRYAPIRTKIALLRESLGFLIGKSPLRKKAVLDGLFGRLGKQYEPKKIS